MKSLLTKHEQRYQLAVQQVEQLQKDVNGLQQKGDSIGDDEAVNSKLKEEVAELKIKVIRFSIHTILFIFYYIESF